MQSAAVNRWNRLGRRVRGAQLWEMGIALLVLCIPGCVHRRAEDRILSAFSGTGPWYFPDSVAPEFVAFRDERSARVFKNLTRAGKYRIAPKDEPLLCPGVPGPGKHGFVLGARVDQAGRETAVATVSEMCRRFVPSRDAGAPWLTGDTMEYDSQYLLQKINGNWRVIKGVNYGVAVR
jgi:hypothetical protein